MILCHSKKYIFVHINKCGGTSVTRALHPLLENEDLVLGGLPETESLSEEYLKEHGIYKHSTASEIREFVGKEIWDSYYKFSIVRNPWEKILSTYFWFHKTKWAMGGKGDHIRRMSFDEYVLSGFMDEKSCTEFLFDKDELLVDDYFDISQLQIAIGYLCGKFDYPPVILPKANSTNHAHYSTYYSDPKVRDFIASNFAEDIANFNYTFEEADAYPDSSLHDSVDFLRDLAIKIESEDIQTAQKLMSLAQRGRPNGPYINMKLLEYDREIKKDLKKSEN